MAVVFINYDEPNTETYKLVGISMNDKGKDGRTEIEFKSGNFVKDWYDCTKHIIENVVDTEPVLHSSSVDHFIMDGAKFDSLWLVNVEKEKWDSSIDVAVQIGMFCQEQNGVLNFHEIEYRVIALDKELP